MSRLELDAEQLDVLERLGRSMLLNLGWSVHVLVAEEPRSLRPALVHLLGACLRGEGEVVEVRHFDHDHDEAAVAAIDALVERDERARQLMFMDFSELDASEGFRACDFFTKLNGRRDTMRTHLRGELVVAIPASLEAAMLSAAPDLASGVRSWMLRRGAFDQRVLERWRARCDERFDTLIAQTAEAEARYQWGTYTFAYCFEPGAVEVPLDELHHHLAAVPGHTGWRPWWTPTTKFVPRIDAGVLECWMFGPEQLFPDPAHSDFWRASPRGELYLRRGYDEDSHDPLVPGRAFSDTLTIERTAEVLLHVDGLARQLKLPRHLRVGLHARWTGMKERTLTTWPEKYARSRGEISHTAEASAQLVFMLSDVPDALASLVGRMVSPLFERFEGYRPAPNIVAEHVRRVVERR
jgi:hypothetical protein